MKFDISIMTLAFLGGGSLLALLAILLLLLGGKKPSVPKGKKGMVAVLAVLSIACFALTPLVSFNVVPLSMQVGYYLENGDFDGDGHVSGYKVTMERKVAFYLDLTTSRWDQQDTDKGRWKLLGKTAVFELPKYGVKQYEVDGIGTKLLVEGRLAFTFIKGI